MHIFNGFNAFFLEFLMEFFQSQNLLMMSVRKNKDAANNSDDDIIEIERVEEKEEAKTSDAIREMRVLREYFQDLPLL